MAWDERLVSGELLEQAFNEKKKEQKIESVNLDDVEKYKKDGFTVLKEYKHTAKMAKNKNDSILFENRVWCLLYKMGYHTMNGCQLLKIPYTDDEQQSKQIDVFAVDDETVIIVECKSSETFKKGADFKTTLESWKAIKPDIFSAVRKVFPNKKLVIIFATNNYEFSKQDADRCNKFGIIHFNEDSIDYYYKLVKHLGKSAKYQLLGSILSGTKIPSLNVNIPAIQGKMGGHTYYSFLIEPSKLLKIGFVLHRNNAHVSLMPTYQRLIKKPRLNAIREYVNSGGYFPNSIIISVTSKNALQFDRAKQDSEGNISRMGILHLPPVYQCAYIIDGQHRLYGYSESRYEHSNTIPVIAFENLEKDEQVKMFMDINENQKPVPKTLRNTLEIDLLWDSSKEELKRKAVMLNIAQDLGEEKGSPFYARIITGENSKTPQRSLTLENMRLAFLHSGLFNTYKSNQIVKEGYFDFNNNEQTYQFIYKLSVKYFEFIKKQFVDEWEKSEKGYLLTNNVIGALILLMGDMINLKIQEGALQPRVSSVSQVYNEIEGYLISLQNVLSNITEDDIAELKSKKGGSAAQKCQQFLGWKLHNVITEFNPDWLEEYIKNNCQDNHDQAKAILDELTANVRKIFISKLNEMHSTKWKSQGLPSSVYSKLNTKLTDKIRDDELSGVDSTNIQYNLLEFASFDDYAKICHHGSNWSRSFRQLFADIENIFSDTDEGNAFNVINDYSNRVSKRNGNLAESEFNKLEQFASEIKKITDNL